VSAYSFFNAFKIGDIAGDAVNAHLLEDFNGLWKGSDYVRDDHVSSDFEVGFWGSIPCWHELLINCALIIA
jgi:hypothetical protein